MTSEELEPYFKGTTFGTKDYCSLVLEGLMKVACGYSNGYTLDLILMEMGYVDNGLLTRDGQKAMYELYEQLKVYANWSGKQTN